MLHNIKNPFTKQHVTHEEFPPQLTTDPAHHNFILFTRYSTSQRYSLLNDPSSNGMEPLYLPESLQSSPRKR